MSSVNHYNRVALQPPADCLSIRTAHRIAKHRFIAAAASKAAGAICNCNVIDFACGRGGDLPKVVGCASYTGIDNADKALAELRRRAVELGVRVSTYCTDAAESPVLPCNLAMCNFALHYFCDTQEHMNALLHKVAQCVLPGGVFCGTYERVKHTPGFGEAYHAVVGSCVDAIEWRVPFDYLQSVMLRYNFAIVDHKPLAYYNAEAEQSIWVFMFQKAQVPGYGRRAAD